MTPLTPREHDALSAVIHGTGDRAAAARDAHMAKNTLNNHLDAAYRKVDAWSITSALFRLGWITIPARPVAIPVPRSVASQVTGPIRAGRLS